MKTLTAFLLGTFLFLLLAQSLLAGPPPALVQLHVNVAAAPGGNGSASAPYQNLPDAVAAARGLWLAAANGDLRIVIRIAPGVYLLTAPLVLDIPNLQLQGSNKMLVDADGWPSGNLKPGTETKITIASSFLDGPLLHVRASSAVLTGHGVTIQNLSLDGNNRVVGSDGHIITIRQVRDFTVKGCIVTGRAFIGIDSRASSGKIIENYITDVGCGACIGAGNASSSADVLFSGNRSVNNSLGGVLLGGSGFELPGIFDSLSAVIEGNDLSNNALIPRFSFGLRIFVIRRDPPDPFNQSTGNVTALIVGNRINNNEFGVVIDAGFPYRTSLGECDSRTYTGTLALTFKDNQILGNLLTPALITFTRETAAVDPLELDPTVFSTAWKYLHGATFIITDKKNNLAGYWLDHPVADPVDPSVDYCGEGGALLGNRLTINGAIIPNGRTVPSPVP
jgi:hypothetical protein